MYTAIVLAILLSASTLAQSPSSTSGPLTTSILFLPDRSGTLEASIINVNQGATTMELDCPQSGDQCALTDQRQPITITEGPSGTATTLDWATSSPITSVEGAKDRTVEGVDQYALHCELDGTTTGTCTVNFQQQHTVVGSDFTSTTDMSSAPAVSALGPTDIAMVPLVVTAGQEKLQATATGNVADDRRVGVGIMGAAMAGVMGFAMMA